ncbi:trypsin-like peptidase domain-containing protein [Staphylococcus pettenkoferi]|uniref:Serine protease n=1 Tax=Staphylococcus pettenkoferi TaxID=170573 RepID=A0A9Q4D6Q3_9STAP|nr:trypsin-like peptidase domain-containing protein [Staphylococcus pettenkoferi]MCY1569430.1 trypsin-like peptidase domain-containing protein [Staphylococcus pettenkoferi]MCY1575739.1 trypsin-like peptidase domain-containing protein [Staphylococcus pettenkoferi]MCY1594330.1 trypsin-like peptidase domain-containing protein [Staphylococcus pettenkoferi]MCY1617361.1 trypsin-like peptidase domain-containing protein [Staphylococcus pettenkoferi]
MNLKKYVISLIVTLACGLVIGAGHASAEEIQQQDNQQDVATHQTATMQADQDKKSQQATPETKSSQVGAHQQATEEDSAQDTSSQADADKAQQQDVATTEEQKSAQQEQTTATQSQQPQNSQDEPQQDHKATHTNHTATQDQGSQVNNKQQPQQKQAPQNNQTQQPQQQDKAQQPSQQAPQAQQDKQKQQKAATAAAQEPKQEQPAANNEQPRNAQIPEGHFQNEIILPNNNRHRIPGTTHGHYQSLCFVDMGDGGIASGVVVGKNTMLTNKHVVKNDSVTAMPAANGQNNFPKGQFKSNNIVRYPGDQDLAVVHFDKNDKGQSIGDVVRPANMADAQQSKVGERMTITGYPGDKPLSTMWESIGKITKNDGSHLEYDASTVGGNSGSGVFNKKRQLIGIHYGGAGKDANGSVPLTGDMLNFVKNNMQ